MTKLAIIDLDGVVVNNDARFERAKASASAKKIKGGIDWGVAFDPLLVSLDRPIEGAVHALHFLVQKNYAIYLLTSRPEHMRDATEAWLRNYALYCCEELVMKDYEVDRYVKTTQWKADRLADFAASSAVTEIVFIDDEESNRQAVEALGVGIVCKADLSDYMDSDKPLIV